MYRWVKKDIWAGKERNLIHYRCTYIKILSFRIIEVLRFLHKNINNVPNIFFRLKMVLRLFD